MPIRDSIWQNDTCIFIRIQTHSEGLTAEFGGYACPRIVHVHDLHDSRVRDYIFIRLAADWFVLVRRT